MAGVTYRILFFDIEIKFNLQKYIKKTEEIEIIVKKIFFT